MELINKLLASLGGLDGALAASAVVVEMLFRFIPTEKPKSIVYLVADIVSGSGKVLTKLGDMLNKVLPQRLK